MASELYVSLRLNILLIIYDVLYCQECCDNCFWDDSVWMCCFVAWVWWIAVFQNQDLQDCDDAGASLGVLSPHCRPSGLRIKSAMTVLMAGMTLGVPCPVDTALKPV